MLLGEAEGLVGDLRGYGDQPGAPRGDLGVVLLECAQGDVAVRAPGAAVEGQDHGARGEQVVQGHRPAGRGGQAEARGPVADGERTVGLPGVGQLLAGPSHDLPYLGGDLLLTGLVEGAEFGVEAGHDVSLLPVDGWVLRAGRRVMRGHLS